MVDFALVARRTALVNIDLQNCFVDPSPISAPDGPTILGRVNRLAAACRAAGILVIHTALVFRPDGSNMGIVGETSEATRGGILSKGARSAALHPDLVVAENDILLDKPRMGAFHGTDLELILRGRGIDTVIISGIATNICCDTTAREAMARDFHVFFLSDGTAAPPMGDLSPVEVQKATLATLGHLFAQVLTVEEMLERIRRSMGESGA
ncbi:MAG: cysteine hydrolase [Thermoleophilia bacterium]|nr:cysteine hydrolase [Thermoleophilia bacterium]